LYAQPGTYIVTLIVSDGTASSAPSTITAYVGTDPDPTPPVSLDLTAGWNLISICREPLDASIDSVLSSIQGEYYAIWTYDAITGQWLRYIVGGPADQNGLYEIRSGIGYWVRMKQPGNLIVQGTQPETAIPLQIGWNMVGYNSETPKSIEDCMFSIHGKYNSVRTYDSNLGKWLYYIPDAPSFLNDLDFMQSGKGYLIDAKEQCVWDVGP
jgi:hypothetical protein